jgi:hypothetical protein
MHNAFNVMPALCRVSTPWRGATFSERQRARLYASASNSQTGFARRDVDDRDNKPGHDGSGCSKPCGEA